MSSGSGLDQSELLIISDSAGFSDVSLVVFSVAIIFLLFPLWFMGLTASGERLLLVDASTSRVY